MNKCKLNSKLFKYAKTINATNFFANRLAFQQPSKALYIISKKIPIKNSTEENFFDTEFYNIFFDEVEFLHEIYTEIKYHWIEHQCYTIKRVSKVKDKNILAKKNEQNANFYFSQNLLDKTGKKIVVLIIKNKFAKNTIILSHGNSSTIGTIYPFIIDMSSQLKCNIIIYDYHGYGKSEGKPSESKIYLDIETVVEFIILKNIFPNKKEFIFMGHSLGSAPTVHLATTSFSKYIRAIILLSPIASSIKLFADCSDNTGLEKIDVFCNLKKITEVNCPIFLIHGKKDEIIPFSQSEEMAKYIKIKHEWYPKNGDHGNILTKYRSKFFTKCKIFIENLIYFENKNTLMKNSVVFKTYASFQDLNRLSINLENHNPFMKNGFSSSENVCNLNKTQFENDSFTNGKIQNVDRYENIFENEQDVLDENKYFYSENLLENNFKLKFSGADIIENNPECNIIGINSHDSDLGGEVIFSKGHINLDYSESISDRENIEINNCDSRCSNLLSFCEYKLNEKNSANLNFLYKN